MIWKQQICSNGKIWLKSERWPRNAQTRISRHVQIRHLVSPYLMAKKQHFVVINSKRSPKKMLNTILSQLVNIYLTKLKNNSNGYLKALNMQLALLSEQLCHGKQESCVQLVKKKLMSITLRNGQEVTLEIKMDKNIHNNSLRMTNTPGFTTKRNGSSKY